jgi:hypothetical protein
MRSSKSSEQFPRQGVFNPRAAEGGADGETMKSLVSVVHKQSGIAVARFLLPITKHWREASLL